MGFRFPRKITAGNVYYPPAGATNEWYDDRITPSSRHNTGAAVHCVDPERKTKPCAPFLNPRKPRDTK